MEFPLVKKNITVVLANDEEELIVFIEQIQKILEQQKVKSVVLKEKKNLEQMKKEFIQKIEDGQEYFFIPSVNHLIMEKGESFLKELYAFAQEKNISLNMGFTVPKDTIPTYSEMRKQIKENCDCISYILCYYQKNLSTIKMRHEVI